MKSLELKGGRRKEDDARSPSVCSSFPQSSYTHLHALGKDPKQKVKHDSISNDRPCNEITPQPLPPPSSARPPPPILLLQKARTPSSVVVVKIKERDSSTWRICGRSRQDVCFGA